MRADVQRIFKKTPADKQVMMFSATLPDETKDVCKKFMRKPVEIIVKEENKEHLEKLQQFYVKLKEEEKSKKLFDILDSVQFNQVIIFVNSILRCETLSDMLTKNNFPSLPFAHNCASFKSLSNLLSKLILLCCLTFLIASKSYFVSSLKALNSGKVISSPFTVFTLHCFW